MRGCGPGRLFIYNSNVKNWSVAPLLSWDLTSPITPMVLQCLQGPLPGEVSFCWQMPSPSRMLWCCDGGERSRGMVLGMGRAAVLGVCGLCCPLRHPSLHLGSALCRATFPTGGCGVWPSHRGLAGVQPVLCHSGCCCQITLWSLLQVLLINNGFKAHHWLTWVGALVDLICYENRAARRLQGSRSRGEGRWWEGAFCLWPRPPGVIVSVPVL